MLASLSGDGPSPQAAAAGALGACRRNAPTSILGGTKCIGRIEIVDPEPDARSHSSSQCRQTHYSDRLLAWIIRETTPPSPCPLPLRGRGIHFDPSPPKGERAG